MPKVHLVTYDITYIPCLTLLNHSKLSYPDCTLQIAGSVGLRSDALQQEALAIPDDSFAFYEQIQQMIVEFTAESEVA